jgi:hypothetical protein
MMLVQHDRDNCTLGGRKQPSQSQEREHRKQQGLISRRRLSPHWERHEQSGPQQQRADEELLTVPTIDEHTEKRGDERIGQERLGEEHQHAPGCTALERVEYQHGARNTLCETVGGLAYELSA